MKIRFCCADADGKSDLCQLGFVQERLGSEYWLSAKSDLQANLWNRQNMFLPVIAWRTSQAKGYFQWFLSVLGEVLAIELLGCLFYVVKSGLKTDLEVLKMIFVFIVNLCSGSPRSGPLIRFLILHFAVRVITVYISPHIREIIGTKRQDFTQEDRPEVDLLAVSEVVEAKKYPIRDKITCKVRFLQIGHWGLVCV